MITEFIIIFTLGAAAAVLVSHIFQSTKLSGKYRMSNAAKPLETSEQESRLEDYSAYTANFNFQRAMELVNQGDDLQAFEYFKKAIDDDSHNGYAHAWIARLYLRSQDYGTALQAINNAISCFSGKVLSPFYVERGRIYNGLGNKDKWLEDARKAVELDDKNANAYGEILEYYYEKGDYDQSDNAAEQIIQIEPHNTYGYMAKGRNEMGRKHYEKALELFEYAGKLDAANSQTKSFAAEACLMLNKLPEAVNLEILALDILHKNHTEDNKAQEVLSLLSRKAFDLLYLKLKAASLKEPEDTYWLSVIGKVCSITRRFVEAAGWYAEGYKLSHDHSLLSFESFCWREAGNYAKAASCLEKALVADPENQVYKFNLMLLYRDMGRFEQGIRLGEELLVQNLDDETVNSSLAKMYQHTGQIDQAIKYYGLALALTNGNDAFCHFNRGISYLAIGDNGAAELDFKEIIDNPSMDRREDYLALSLILCKKEESLSSPTGIQIMEALDDRIRKAQSEYDGFLFDPMEMQKLYLIRASVLCRIGKVTEALADIQNMLDCGGACFSFCRTCFMLQPLQEMAEFTSMLDKQEQALQLEWDTIESKTQANVDATIPSQGPNLESSSIEYVKEGGVCKVPCKINGLPLHFIFDTGASDVTMSSVEATFMLKNGFLYPKDLSGKEYYMTASGEIAEGTKVKLREVKFGTFTLNNVKASVVKSQTAPLLLGQSVLQRIGRIEIDNENQIIRVNP